MHTNFYILAEGRCGSNLMIDLLNKSDNVFCYNELFIEDNLNFQRALDFLNQEKIKNEKPCVSIGCKILYYQFDYKKSTEQRKKMMSLLDKDSSRIFHMYRENTTERFISDYLSTYFKDWVNYADKLDKLMTIPIDYALQLKEGYEDMHKRVAEPILNKYPDALRISYEKFIENKNYSVNKVLEVIGGSPTIATESTRFKKQASSKSYSLIENLKEIEEVFGFSVKKY